MSETIEYTRLGDLAVICVKNPPVNALSHAVRQGLMDAMDRAEADAGVKAVVLCGEGRAFLAGADISEFGKPPMPPHLPDVCQRIEDSPLLVIASLHGVSLGGGLEVALSAHYRIAQPSARVGLPEVHLGLIPGAGGTQRLPRLIGAEPALEIMTSGRQVKASEALDLGLIDQIEEGSPLEIGLAYGEALLQKGAARRPISALPAATALDWPAVQAAIEKKSRGLMSPGYAVRAVEAASTLPFEAGMQREAELFMELLQTDQSKGMIHAFFSERAVSHLPELKGVIPRQVAAVGVIGGGTMGAGIATAALLAGYKVTLIEMSDAGADAARDRVAGNLSGALKRGKITQETYDRFLEQDLVVATTYDTLDEVDLVIEAVFEDMAVKKEVFGKLDAVCKPGCILASNTSYLDINEIAASTQRPADVVGLHFFSPAHVMKLLEVVVADQTALDVTATGFALGKALGKICVRAGVCDGFIGNRILAHYRDAAGHMVLEGASPFQIDAALERFGFAMGPHAVSDLAGLDIGWATRKRKAPHRHPAERIPTYIDRLCEAGHFGQKTGKGYYVYEKGSRTRTPNPEIAPLIAAEQAERQITPRDFSDQEIVQRYMCAMVNEAAKVLGEGIARRPLDVDMTLLFGYGFPRFWGGPMKWADLQGLPQVLAWIEDYAKTDAWFWEPASVLRDLVAEGRSFDDLNTAA